MATWRLALLVLALLLPAAATSTTPTLPADAGWDALLQRHVHWQPDGGASQVDYAGFASERAALDAYLAQLAAVDPATFERWPPARRTAFLVNAYNAATVALVLRKYPDLDSIKELGSWLSSPWEQRFVELLGATRTLDEIEHQLLRGAPGFAEPRVHFAVNCASIGCPALRPEAYRADTLDAQLDDQVRRFLGDRSRNRLDLAAASVQVSKIFDWYAEDFEAGHAGIDSVAEFLGRHADALADDAAGRTLLASGEFEIEYLPYDWSLNDRR